MREKGSVVAVCAVTTMLSAAAFGSPSARALPLSGYSGLNAAIHHATTTQKARHVCRGRHRCHYVSRPPEQTTRPTRQEDYHRSGWNGM
jgi:hypothetical protein